MSRLTKKFGDKVLIPMIPMEIKTKEDLDKFHKVVRKYEKMVIKLAEYEDREEINNCKHCCGNIDMRDYILYNGYNGIYIDVNGNLVGDDDFDFQEKQLNFCPMCGRKLNKLL